MRGSSHAGDNDGMKNERLSDKVAAQLRGLVSTQNLQPGDRLPAERALAVQLGCHALPCVRRSRSWPVRAC